MLKILVKTAANTSGDADIINSLGIFLPHS